MLSAFKKRRIMLLVRYIVLELLENLTVNVQSFEITHGGEDGASAADT